MIRWNQTNDPLSEIHQYNVPGNAEGFSLDTSKTNMKHSCFSGLKRYSPSTLLAGFDNNLNWYYAVGASDKYYAHNFPGPSDAIVSKVCLWVKITEIPNFLFKCHSNIYKQRKNINIYSYIVI